MMNGSETKTYLELLFSDKPANEKILIWTLPDKLSRWVDSIDEAIGVVEEKSEAFNVFAGIATSATDNGPHSKGKQNAVASLFCVWADIDINGPGHKSTKGAADEAAAMRLVENVGVVPSMIVFSGGGIHAYWIFKEPWTFETDSDRTEAYNFSTAWQRTIQAHADALGFKVDGTFNLDRVLRIPGTWNRKPGITPVQCSIRQTTDLRYDPSELREFLTPETRANTTRTGPEEIRETIEHSGLTFNFANPIVDIEKHEMLCEVEPRFKGSWERTRDTAQWKNATASEFDMSLASFAVSAEWSDQEVINLLIKNRKKHKDDLKRPDYYVRTLIQAKQIHERRKALDDARRQVIQLPEQETFTPEGVGFVGGDEPTARQETNDAERKKNLDDISAIIGTKITQIIRYKQDPPKYQLVTAKGAIELGEVDRLINQGPLRNAIAATTGHYVPKIPNNEWDYVAQLLLHVCETVDTGPETTDIGAMKSWLTTYLDEQIPGDMASANIANQTPVKKADEPEYVYFWLANFRKWLDVREGEKFSTKAAGLLLRKFGCCPLPVAFKIESTNERNEVSSAYTTRNLWRVRLEDLHGRPVVIPANGNGTPGNGSAGNGATPGEPIRVPVVDVPETAPRTPVAAAHHPAEHQAAAEPAKTSPPLQATLTEPAPADTNPGGAGKRVKTPNGEPRQRPPRTRKPKPVNPLSQTPIESNGGESE